MKNCKLILILLTFVYGQSSNSTNSSSTSSQGTTNSSTGQGSRPNILEAVFYNCTLKSSVSFNILSQIHSSMGPANCPKELYLEKETLTLNLFYNTSTTRMIPSALTMNIIQGNSTKTPPNLLQSARVNGTTPSGFTTTSNPALMTANIVIDPSLFNLSLIQQFPFVAHVQLVLTDVFTEQGTNKSVPNVNTLEIMNLNIYPENLAVPPSTTIVMVPTVASSVPLQTSTVTVSATYPTFTSSMDIGIAPSLMSFSFVLFLL